MENAGERRLPGEGMVGMMGCSGEGSLIKKGVVDGDN